MRCFPCRKRGWILVGEGGGLCETESTWIEKNIMWWFHFSFRGGTILNWNHAALSPAWHHKPGPSYGFTDFNFWSPDFRFSNIFFKKLYIFFKHFFIPYIFTTLFSCKLNERENLLKNLYTTSINYSSPAKGPSRPTANHSVPWPVNSTLENSI